MAESFISSLKKERIRKRTYKTRDMARMEAKTYVGECNIHTRSREQRDRGGHFDIDTFSLHLCLLSRLQCGKPKAGEFRHCSGLFQYLLLPRVGIDVEGIAQLMFDP